MPHHRPPPRRPVSFDADAIVTTIEKALSFAGVSAGSGKLRGVTDTIRRALSGRSRDDFAPADPHDDVIEHGQARQRPDSGGDARPGGQFVRRRYSGPAGTREYALYVPAGDRGTPRPLVVMLHGCTQSADDFALGTGMARLADAHDLLVAYPEQPSSANPSRCWNWFNPGDQGRDRGEPALIAGITREIASHHAVDPGRIFIAGLSAGAAMAVILGEAYPDLYAAVGAHSGLPYGAAHDMASALAAMRGKAGRARPGVPAGIGGSLHQGTTRFVPTIVFHGDADRRVGLDNGEALARQATAAFTSIGGTPQATTTTAVSAGGRRYSRTVQATAAGQPRVELWLLHGAGHAWSGGDRRGSYTDPRGPDASAEMVRFFLAQRAEDRAGDR